MHDPRIDELTRLSAGLEQATHRQLTLIRELEAAGVWLHEGAVTYAAWLGFRLGLAPVAAREKVRVARALGGLPLIDAAFAAARITYSKVRALTRVAGASNEAILLEMALCATAAQLERICRGVRAATHEPAQDRERRWLRARTTDDGMVRIEVQLHPDEAARVMDAVHAVRRSTDLDAPDALLRLLERPSPDAQSGADRTELVVMLRQAAHAVTTTLADGAALSPEALRRCACDTAIVPVTLDRHDLPIDVGRKTRVVPAALRRALRLRDHGRCRFPGCEHRAWLDAHHVEHWMHGGETALANLVSLCPAHHRLVHEGGITVAMHDGVPRFGTADGRRLPGLPPRVRAPHRPRPASAEAGDALGGTLLRRGPDYGWAVQLGMPGADPPCDRPC